MERWDLFVKQPLELELGRSARSMGIVLQCAENPATHGVGGYMVSIPHIPPADEEVSYIKQFRSSARIVDGHYLLTYKDWASTPEQAGNIRRDVVIGIVDLDKPEEADKRLHDDLMSRAREEDRKFNRRKGVQALKIADETPYGRVEQPA